MQVSAQCDDFLVGKQSPLEKEWCGAFPPEWYVLHRPRTRAINMGSTFLDFMRVQTSEPIFFTCSRERQVKAAATEAAAAKVVEVIGLGLVRIVAWLAPWSVRFVLCFFLADENYKRTG